MDEQTSAQTGQPAETREGSAASESMELLQQSCLQEEHKQEPAWSQHHGELVKVFKENPAPELGTIFNRDLVWILELTPEEQKDPEMRRIANQMASTNVRYMIAKANAHFKERTVRLAEQRADEAKKSEQARALEFCLDEAKKFPAVDQLFRTAFAALKKAKAK
jgi:hypothetical protein